MGAQAVASGATWGISGPRFAALYALVVLAAVLVTALRRRGPGGGPEPADAGLHPHEMAYLRGGPKLAADTVLTGLRAAEVLEPGERARTVRLTGRPEPAGLTDPDRAAMELARTASATTGRYERLRDALAARPEVTGLRRRLESLGLLRTERAVAAHRRGDLLLWSAVLALGVARLAAGIAGHKPVTFLVLLLIAAAVGTAVTVASRPDRTPAGSRLLQAARSDTAGAADAASIGAARFGPVGASYAVALFGATALWASDPAFAAAIGAPRYAAGDAGAGAGSSCGGGGGCGGGGCGG